MILSSYIIGSAGDFLHSKSYQTEVSSSPAQLPDYAERIVTLYRTTESTRLEHAYFHEQNGKVWVYVFFDQFVIILQTTEDEDRTSITRRIISMGRAIARIYSQIDSTSSKETTTNSDFDAIVNRYVTLDFSAMTDSLLAVIELLIYSALEKFNIAYAGVFDVQGRQIKGNVPERHVRIIGTQLSEGTLKSSVDIVPSTLLVDGHEAQLLKVKYLTAVAAPYRDSSRLPATRAVGEMAESLRDAITKLNTTSK